MSNEQASNDWNLIPTNRQNRLVSPDTANTSRDRGIRHQTNPFEVLDGDSSAVSDTSYVFETSDSTLSLPNLEYPDPITDSGATFTEFRAAILTEHTNLRRTLDAARYYVETPFPPPQDSRNDDSSQTDTTETASDDESLYSMGSDTSTSPKGNLLESMMTMKADLNPITKDRNYAQVVTFREAIGSTLAQFPSLKHDGGYAWLVDTEQTYQERLGDPLTIRPKAPPRPKEPTPDSTTGRIDKTQLYQYNRDLKEYKECVHWTNQVLSIIELKFPFSLEAKRNRFEGFPLSFSCLEAIELVETTVNKPIPRREAHCAMQLTVLTKAFHFTTDDSTIEFLKEMEKLKHDLDILDCGGMEYDNLIVHCLAAFRNSHLPTDKTRTIETAWNQAESLEPHHTTNTRTTSSATARWERFKAHYISEIEDLREDGLLQTGKAKLIVEDRLHELETRFTQHDYELEAINDTQSVHSKAFRTMTDKVPSMIGTTLGSPSAMSATINSQQITDIVNKAFEARLADFQGQQGQRQQPQQATQRAGTPGGVLGTTPGTANRTDVWRQWKNWCHTHGTNLRHDSPGCDHPRDGHKNEATKTNPMGGNTKRDHLWGKWCSPEDHKPYDTPT